MFRWMGRAALILLGALVLTVLSLLIPSWEQGFYGNLCGPQDNRPCPVTVRRGGWPQPYVTEDPNAPAYGGFGFDPDDRWSGRAFALDTAFYLALLTLGSAVAGRRGKLHPQG